MAPITAEMPLTWKAADVPRNREASRSRPKSRSRPQGRSAHGGHSVRYMCQLRFERVLSAEPHRARRLKGSCLGRRGARVCAFNPSFTHQLGWSHVGAKAKLPFIMLA